jgi:hypothetical protein
MIKEASDSKWFRRTRGQLIFGKCKSKAKKVFGGLMLNMSHIWMIPVKGP